VASLQIYAGYLGLACSGCTDLQASLQLPHTRPTSVNCSCLAFRPAAVLQVCASSIAVSKALYAFSDTQTDHHCPWLLKFLILVTPASCSCLIKILRGPTAFSKAFCALQTCSNPKLQCSPQYSQAPSCATLNAGLLAVFHYSQPQSMQSCSHELSHPNCCCGDSLTLHRAHSDFVPRCRTSLFTQLTCEAQQYPSACCSLGRRDSALQGAHQGANDFLTEPKGC